MADFANVERERHALLDMELNCDHHYISLQSDAEMPLPVIPRNFRDDFGTHAR
jgi:hypothetical protein